MATTPITAVRRRRIFGGNGDDRLKEASTADHDRRRRVATTRSTASRADHLIGPRRRRGERGLGDDNLNGGDGNDTLNPAPRRATPRSAGLATTRSWPTTAPPRRSWTAATATTP